MVEREREVIQASGRMTRCNVTRNYTASFSWLHACVLGTVVSKYKWYYNSKFISQKVQLFIWGREHTYSLV